MKTVFILLSVTLMAGTASAQSSSAELTCRAQAKELAVQQYTSCITIARNNQVEEIRKNYQKELAALKAKYDKELKKMGANTNMTSKDKKAAKNAIPTSKELKKALVTPPVPTKGIAKELPGKAPVEGDALPVQNVSEGTKVVTVEFEDSSSVVESEAVANEEIEMSAAPVE